MRLSTQEVVDRTTERLTDIWEEEFVPLIWDLPDDETIDGFLSEIEEIEEDQLRAVSGTLIVISQFMERLIHLGIDNEVVECEAVHPFEGVAETIFSQIVSLHMMVRSLTEYIIIIAKAAGKIDIDLSYGPDGLINHEEFYRSFVEWGLANGKTAGYGLAELCGEVVDSMFDIDPDSIVPPTS